MRLGCLKRSTALMRKRVLYAALCPDRIVHVCQRQKNVLFIGRAVLLNGNEGSSDWFVFAPEVFNDAVDFLYFIGRADVATRREALCKGFERLTSGDDPEIVNKRFAVRAHVLVVGQAPLGEHLIGHEALGGIELPIQCAHPIDRMMPVPELNRLPHDVLPVGLHLAAELIERHGLITLRYRDGIAYGNSISKPPPGIPWSRPTGLISGILYPSRRNASRFKRIRAPGRPRFGRSARSMCACVGLRSSVRVANAPSRRPSRSISASLLLN